MSVRGDNFNKNSCVSVSTPILLSSPSSEYIECDRYGTRRHAAAMVGLWRTQFPGDEADVVWEACAESGVMEEMGYTQ